MNVDVLTEQDRSILRQHGGQELLGDGFNVAFEPWDDIDVLNRTCLPAGLHGRYLLFASDGGGEVYAIDLQNAGQPIVMLPLIGISEAPPITIASSLAELLSKLATP